MASRLQLRRGTKTEHDSFTGQVGETTVDTTNDDLRVHDGSTVGGKSAAQGKVFDGIKALVNAPLKDRAQYDVTGFYAGSEVGGGQFVYDASRDKADHNGGTVITPEAIAAWDGTQGNLNVLLDWTGTGTGAFVRTNVENVFISTFDFGIPLQSNDVDYTSAIQSVISQRFFYFPENFESSCLRLFAKSNTTGFFGNAKLKMLSGTHPQTSLVTFAESVSNVNFYGGVIDGNRNNITSSGSPDLGYLWSGDGGMHCIQFAQGADINWYNPTCLNADTDGIYIRASGSGGTLKNIHIYDPLCDNCSRQGLSDAGSGVGGTGVDVYNGQFLNTNGKSPEAGVDIEPLEAEKYSNIRFHGETVCKGNAGAGLFADPNTGEVSFMSFGTLKLTNNGATSGFRLTGGDDMIVTGDKLITDAEFNFGGEGEKTFISNYVECEVTQTSGVGSGFLLNIEVKRMICGVGYSAAFDGPFKLSGNKKGVIGHLTCVNGSTDSQGRAGELEGGGLVINRLDYQSSRGLYFNGDGSGSEVNIFIDDPQLAEGCRVNSGASNWNISIIKKVIDGQTPARISGDDNKIQVQFRNGDAGLLVEGSGNSLTVDYTGSVANPVSFNSTSSNNVIFSSHLGSSGVSDSGTGNTIVGSYPLNRNT